MTQPAFLTLADGTVFAGQSFGAPGLSVGEVVFNTAMTGYQEILTDPSYARQIIALTYPHIGNTGCVDNDDESAKVFAAGLIVRELPLPSSSWRSQHELPAWLVERGVLAIAEIDTRRLTRILRTTGAQSAAIMAGPDANPDDALKAARGFVGLQGMDLAKEVSTRAAYDWRACSIDLDTGIAADTDARFHVVAYDFGIKRNILRMLADRGCRLTVVPAQTGADDVMALKPDGVFLSNGPGDPEPCDYAITAIRALLAARVPIFGICLGHQLLGLAAGARTMKMKFGHHGANHPVQDIASGSVIISSQNHGFAVDQTSLPANVSATHRSLFDGSLQGLKLSDAPAFSFQGHPEASPGPRDVASLFDRFVESMHTNGRNV